MIITWLKGVKRIRGPKFTQEISGYKCSHCNAFESSPRRECPVCGGTYKGKLLPGVRNAKVIPNDEVSEDEQT
jgi:rRNA maturation endonuclease Nob1